MPELIVRNLDELQSYQATWHAMKTITQTRTPDQPDEIWLLQHESVFTQGLAGKPEHILNPHDIPVIQTDRGGQVTYHGPGQLVAYFLMDIKRFKLNVREFVTKIAQIVIDYLADYQIIAEYKTEAPGVYINGAKICSIGLRIRKGCSYHGLAFNIAMDMIPFQYINPCGFAELKMSQLTDYKKNITVNHVSDEIIPYILKHFRYNQTSFTSSHHPLELIA